MGRIEEALATARQQGRAALIPYVTAGFPSLGQLPGLVEALTDAGADLIEIGIPFSDPLADGPVLQRAATAALAGGVKVRDILDCVAEISPHAPPLVFLTYVNPVFHFGVDPFIEAAHRAGVTGLIVPDLPWREAGAVRAAARQRGLAVIPLVAPTSTEQHLRQISKASGFVYAVSVTGVTGVRSSVGAEVRPLVDRVKAVVPLPVAVGFGISTPEHAREVGQVADGVIVGSALVQVIGENPGQAAESARQFVGAMKMALTNSVAKA